MVAGALLPWLTMFAGLQVYRGVIGLNGRLILGVGIVLSISGVIGLARGLNTRTLRVAGAVAAATALFGGVLLYRMIEMWRNLSANDAMMIARPGIGLPCVLVGGLLSALALRQPQTRRLRL